MKSEYLNYIRLIYDRESSKGKQSGVTLWGGAIGIVYVLWNLIDVYPSIRSNSVALQSAILLYAFIQLSIGFSVDLLRSRNRPGSSSEFNIRIRGSGFSNGMHGHIGLFLLWGLPFVAIFSSRAANDQSFPPDAYKVIEFMSSFDTYALGIFIAFIVIFFVYGQIYEKRTGYPSPYTFALLASDTNTNKKLTSVFSAIGSVIGGAGLIILAFGNALAAYMMSSAVEGGVLKNVLVFSFDLALIILAINYLRNIDFQADRLERLNALERDIVFHDLSDEKVRERLQEDLIGHAFGDWLRNKLAEVKHDSDVLVDLVNQVDVFLTEVERLPIDHRFEREGRLDEYLHKIEAASTSYNNKTSALLNWTKAVLESQQSYKSHVVLTLKSISEELNAMHNLTAESSLRAIGKLKDFIVKKRQPLNLVGAKSTAADK